MTPNDVAAKLTHIAAALRLAVDSGDLGSIAKVVTDLELLAVAVDTGQDQQHESCPKEREMTLADLNQWMLQVTTDNWAYGLTQSRTLRNLDHVVSGRYLGESPSDEEQSRGNKLGEAVEDWYGKWMTAYLALPVVEDERDEGDQEGSTK